MIDPIFMFIISFLGIIGVQPYNLRIIKKLNKNKIKYIALASFVQLIILMAISSFIGSYFANKIGFVFLPLDEGIDEIYKLLTISIALGFIVAAILYFIDKKFFLNIINKFPSYLIPNKLEIFGLALYGGICEELLCRLFALSLIFYIFAWTGILGIIVSVIISSLIFALGHLPTALNLIGGHREVVKRTIYLNIIGGVVFCFIFIFFGLFFSMVSHATSDIILNIMNLKIK